MSDREKYAYRRLLYWTIVQIRNSCSDYGQPSRAPWRWWRGYLRSREAGWLADWLHNLAEFSSRDFERFDTVRFWNEYEILCQRFPSVQAYGLREYFEEHHPLDS